MAGAVVPLISMMNGAAASSNFTLHFPYAFGGFFVI